MLDLVLLFLIVYLSYQNAQVAQKKGKSSVLWVILTVVAMFVTGVVGAIIVLIGYRGEPTPDALNAFLAENPLKVVIVHVCTLGGYLLTRYILEQMPDVKKKG